MRSQLCTYEKDLVQPFSAEGAVQHRVQPFPQDALHYGPSSLSWVGIPKLEANPLEAFAYAFDISYLGVVIVLTLLLFGAR